MAIAVAADTLGEEWKGSNQWWEWQTRFPHEAGSKGHSCCRPRWTGERKCKSVPICTVDANLNDLNWVIVKKKGGGGSLEKDIPGLTDATVPHQLGPKRASRIWKLFDLSKEDDVCQYVVRKPLNKGGKKPRSKAPKSECLVTPRVLQYKYHMWFWRNNVLRKIRKRPQNMLDFWLREWRRQEKCWEQIAKSCRLSWELLPLSLSPIKN